jgi:hypothetical protein
MSFSPERVRCCCPLSVQRISMANAMGNCLNKDVLLALQAKLAGTM